MGIYMVEIDVWMYTKSCSFKLISCVMQSFFLVWCERGPSVIDAYVYLWGLELFYLYTARPLFTAPKQPISLSWSSLILVGIPTWEKLFPFGHALLLNNRNDARKNVIQSKREQNRSFECILVVFRSKQNRVFIATIKFFEPKNKKKWLTCQKWTPLSQDRQ